MLQVLFSEAGYKYIDVRPAFEFDDAGHCKQAINIPVMNLERKWSPEEQKKARSIFHSLLKSSQEYLKKRIRSCK